MKVSVGTTNGENKLRIIRSAYYYFKAEVNFWKFCVAGFSPKFDRKMSKNVSEMAKNLTAQIKPHISDPFDPISILRLLKNFKLASDTSGLQEGVAMSFFHFFINKSASTVLDAIISWDPSTRNASRKTTVKSRYIITYPQAVIFLLEKFPTDESIA